MELIKLCPAGHVNPPTAFLCEQCSALLNSAPTTRQTEPNKTEQIPNSAKTITCPNPVCGHPDNSPTATFCQLCLTELDASVHNNTPSAHATKREIQLRIRFPFGSFPLENKFYVGREPGYSSISKELEIFDGVSRRHAEFSVSGLVLTVTDLGSTNKVFVNGKDIQPYKPVIVEVGDEISFGRRLLGVIVSD